MVVGDDVLARNERSMPVSQPKKMPLGAKIILGFVIIVFIGSGGRLVYMATDGMREAGESASWPRTAGKIVRSEMKVTTGDDGPGRRSSSGPAFEADIEYAFDVNGIAYHGSRIASVKDMNAKRSRAQSILDRYPVDGRVMVSYRPDDPSVCVLEPGSWGGALVQLALGVFFILVPLVLVFTIWKLAPKSPPAPPSEDNDPFSAPRFDEAT